MHEEQKQRWDMIDKKDRFDFCDIKTYNKKNVMKLLPFTIIFLYSSLTCSFYSLNRIFFSMDLKNKTKNK